MKLTNRFHFDPSLIDEIDVFEPPSKFFQDNLDELSLEEIQMLVNLLNKYFMKSKAQEENFAYMQQQYEVAQRKYVDLFYFSPVGYFILDRHGQILESNLTATNLLGYPNSSIIGKNITNFLITKDVDKLRDHHTSIFAGERKGVFEVGFKMKNQQIKATRLESILWPDEYGELTRIRTAVIDISNQKTMEDKFRQGAKMDAIESLVGSIAHDFNNILHSIISNTEILAQDEHLPSNINKHLTRILDLSGRAADSISQLLDIGSQSTSQQVTIETAEFLRQHQSKLEQFLPNHITVEWRLPQKSECIHADPEQLQLVLINLLINSVNAMPNGGMVTIDQFKHEPTRMISMRPELSKGAWQVIRITDTGVGIPAEMVEKLFEPDFRVKPTGFQKGFGLPRVQGIMRQHGGIVHIESWVGTGTAVYLYFPVLQGQEHKIEPPSEKKALVDGHGLTILLVEDEIEVGESFREILEYLGFSVMMAVNGKVGLELYKKAAGNIQLIITDLVMPEMDGESFLKAVHAIDQTVKIIAISGYPLAQRIDDLKKTGISGFVQKPFTIQKISTVIKDILQQELAA